MITDNNYNHREISFYHINVCGLTSKMKNPVFTDHICGFEFICLTETKIDNVKNASIQES